MNKTKIVSFGKGWIIIIFCLLMFFFYGGMTTDGTNLSIPACAERLGISTGLMQTVHSFAAMLGVVVNLIMSRLIVKFGAHKSAGVCLVYGAVAYMLMPHCVSIPMYMICAAFMWSGMATAAFTCGGILVASYFPKTKGVVMGYTTMGLNLNSACFIAIVSGLQIAMGGSFSSAVIPICIATIVLGIILFLFIKDKPMEIGMYPDNVEKEAYEREYAVMDNIENDTCWTTNQLLKNSYFWLVAVVTGMFNIATGCLVSNMVARNMEMGMTQGQAVSIMTVVALIGLFGSWIIGVFDDRFGTKKTMIGFGVFYFAAGVFNWLSSITGSMVPLYISIVMIGIGIGGSANFTSSLPASVFGRRGFNRVNGLLFPVQGIINCSCFLVSGLLRIVTGDDLKWIFFFGSAFALLAAILSFLIRDEHKYNVDWKR